MSEQESDVALLKNSGFFDEHWYRRQYPDVDMLGMNPAAHYLELGAALGRDPGPNFSTRQYLSAHPDVAKSNQNPLVHYLRNEQPLPPRPEVGRKQPNLGAPRKQLLSAVERCQMALDTPYYNRLKAIIDSSEANWQLEAIARTIDTIDVPRIGQVPMQTGPKVSVVMPVRNRLGLVEDAVESVLRQTYQNFELIVCDDASDDGTLDWLKDIPDARVKVLSHSERKGAAVARNTCLASADGVLVAYLDSDNLWHPRYLEIMTEQMQRMPGNVCAYASYLDVDVEHKSGTASLRSAKVLPFHLEDQVARPYVDLNSFMHRRELVDVFGGFDELLERRQDYDLIIRYCWIREPSHVPFALNIYQRIDEIGQITKVQKHNEAPVDRIRSKIEACYTQGLPAKIPEWVNKVTVLSWDVSRNHFSKAYSVAEALSRQLPVELVSFQFFEDEIFPPYAGIEPPFEMKIFQGCEFPAFFEEMAKAIHAISGDVIYCVKPKLPSLGVALMSNYHTGKPILLEANDLETVVSNPNAADRHEEKELESVLSSLADAKNPHDLIWSQVLDKCARELPVLYTHNINLNVHFDQRALYMRNVKDETLYDPEKLDRDAIRAGLGFSDEDRVILFGGLVRKHKGIFDQIELLDTLADERYKLLVVGSRESPDLKKVREQYAGQVKVLPPQSPQKMAEINAAADLIILTLDPAVAASNYQCPYKITDAFAMRTAVIASPVSDLAKFGERDLLWTVQPNDVQALAETVNRVFADPNTLERRLDRGRRMFEREFSYLSVPPAFALGVALLDDHNKVYSISKDFARVFGEFKRRAEVGIQRDLVEDESIEVLDSNDPGGVSHKQVDEVAVVMLCTDTRKALETARTLVKRAGMETRVYVVTDVRDQGFVKTLNDTARHLNVRYLVYLTENAFPGVDWLKIAYERLEASGKGLLAFNCGKWGGRAATFAMVRKAWVTGIYHGPPMFPGYTDDQADIELTVIARLMEQWLYEPDALLVDINEHALKGQEELSDTTSPEDRKLFSQRLSAGFDGRFAPNEIEQYADEYPNLHELRAKALNAVTEVDDSVQMVDVREVEKLDWRDAEGIAIIMPCIDPEKGMNTARLLLRRGGIAARVFVVEDTLRQGFIRTLNATAAQLDVKYIVYLAEDAFPGDDWLKIAHADLEQTGKGLVAFNCGKWRGRVAAFGMVRKAWVETLYHGSILYEGYKAHKADNELTVIARVTDQLVYDPDSVLVENDAGKVFKENVPEDKTLFHQRFKAGFDGLVPVEDLRPLAETYFVPLETGDSKGGSAKTEATSISDFIREPLTADENEALKAEYVRKGLDKEPDTFVLYRIVGNDLTPRHRKGQSRENLRFILENEQPYDNCEKRFIVNRIIDRDEERAIIELLESYDVPYTVLPFDKRAYAGLGFDFVCLDRADLLSGPDIDKFEPVKRQRLQLALYRHKNNYVMNNNGARNFALGEGRSRAKWVLPFDGNCFITPAGWEQLRAEIVERPHLKYFVVPMTRVTSNENLLSNDFTPEPIEEPQIIFRKDASESFNEAFCYGRRPKVELFWRLRVAGKWDSYKDDAWDQKRLPPSSEARQFGVAGWVARLFSGVSQLESQDTAGTDQRYLARADAILSTLRSLDASLAGADNMTTVSIRDNVLRTEVKAESDTALANPLEVLRNTADEALTRGPYSVADKLTLPPSGDKQDYWHPAPYWWPNPDKPDGLPYVRKDGERVPGTEMYAADSDKYDRTRLQRVFDDSMCLALAWKYFGQKDYADHGANILKRFFVDPATRMNPHLSYGQVRMGHNNNLGAPSGIIEMKDLYYYLDAVRLFREAGAVGDDDLNNFRTWLETYLNWLLTSSQGKTERAAKNNHGTCYDLQVAAIAAFLEDHETLYETLVRAESRIGQQFAPDGSQPEELARKTTAHYCCFNFQSWVNLAELASRWGVDIWARETSDGAGLKRSARWLADHMDKPWPYEQIDEFDSERFYPIWFAAAEHVVDLLRPDTIPDSAYQAKPVYFPHDGIRPFWNLASYGRAIEEQQTLAMDNDHESAQRNVQQPVK